MLDYFQPKFECWLINAAYWFHTAPCDRRLKPRTREETTSQLDLFRDGPDVACERVGAALNGPGCQGKLVAEQVGVALCVAVLEGIQVAGQSLESVRAETLEDVTERTINRGHVGGQQVPFHLRTQEEELRRLERRTLGSLRMLI